MRLNGQLHAWAIEPPVPIKQTAGCAPETFCTFWTREKSLNPTRNQTISFCDISVALKTYNILLGLCEHITCYRSVTVMDPFKFLFQWEAFTLPELNNFLRILDREEEEYKNMVRKKYEFLGRKIQDAMDRLQSVQKQHQASKVQGSGEGNGGS